jgi:phosphoribosylamine---glycine ligase
VPKILVVGSGGREHALAWQLARDGGAQLYAAPGNPGIASLARCLPIDATALSSLASAAEQLHIDLTVVGPEAPIAAGLVDAFAARGLLAFGPTQRASQVEASKVFAKNLMARAHIPTAPFAAFDNPADAAAFVRRVSWPLVVKADGLAAGKGVVVAGDTTEALAAIDALMVRRVHGDAGSRVVIEEKLEGEEVTVLAFVHGANVWPLLPARDFKRAADGDAGPNTGGMGSVAPPPLPMGVMDQIISQILEPAAAAMAADGCPFVGVLYAGIMLTPTGPQTLEFNCRFGDPETQVILPLLDAPLTDVLLDVVHGRQPVLRWADESAVCVVLASGGYPGQYRTGLPISGLNALPEEAMVFHAGTGVRGTDTVTTGGRVLNIVARGASIPQASDRAYAAIGGIRFDAMQYRRDIGRAVADTPSAPAIAGGGMRL